MASIEGTFMETTTRGRLCVVGGTKSIATDSAIDRDPQ